MIIEESTIMTISDIIGYIIGIYIVLYIMYKLLLWGVNKANPSCFQKEDDGEWQD